MKACCLFGLVLVLGSSAAPQARGDVSFLGSVDPEPPVSGGPVGGSLLIGTDQATNPDLFGLVQVDDGTTLGYDRTVVGEEAGYSGDLTVSGPGTILELDDTSSSNPALQIGDEGVGTLRVEDQASVDVFNSARNEGQVVLGKEVTGLGYAVVDGHLTRLTIGERLIVGDEGLGELRIRNRGLVMFTDEEDAFVTIGNAASSTGNVYVEGAATIWQIPENLTVGASGAALLSVTDNAFVNAGGATTVGTRGRVELSSGTFAAGTLSVDGVLAGDGLVTGDITVNDTGEATVGAGEKLRLTGAVTNDGVIETTGGEIEFLGAVTNSAVSGSDPPGRVSATDGTIRFYTPFTNDGVLASAFGQNRFFGDITNSATGSIVVAGESGATFYGPLDVGAGTLTVFEGSTALLLDDAAFGVGSLSLQIGGIADLSEIAQVEVAGAATLGGTLDVSLVGGAAPEEGDTYEVISAAGGVTGTFATENLPALSSGLEWSVNYQANSVVLEVIPDAGGSGAGQADLDVDNDIDLADLMLWQLVDATPAGLNAWTSGFTGQPLSGVSTVAVPEPAAIVLALLGGLAALPRRKRV